MNLDIIVIGHLLKEKIIFPDGKEMGPVLGSPAAYSSVASAKLGLKTGLVTRIGEDMPEDLLKVFKETGVDTEGVKIGKNTTANLLIYEKSGNKKLQFLKKADNISFKDIPEGYLCSLSRSTGSQLPEADKPVERGSPSTLSPVFLIAPIDYEVEEDLIKSLYQKGKRLSMELSGFGGASSGKNGKTKEEKIELLQRITPCFEIVKGGKEDCSCLFGDIDEREAAKQFIEWGAKVVIITLGADGALIATCHCKERDSSFPIVRSPERSQREAISPDSSGAGPVSGGAGSTISKNPDSFIKFHTIPAFSPRAAKIDCTGAGDVWHAGFLAEYLKIRDLKKAGIFASAVSSLLIEKTGGVKEERFPSREEVIRLIRSAGSHSTLPGSV